MIQIILMLLGLAFSDNNANISATDNNVSPAACFSSGTGGIAPEDTSGETGQILPPKK